MSRRRRRIAMGLAILLAALVGGDPLLRLYAEHRTAKRVACELDADHTHVGIAGPFLGPQLARNRFTHVVTTSVGVRSGGVPVTVVTDLHNVHPINAETVKSGAGRITVTVPVASLSASAAGYEVSTYDGSLVATPTTGPDLQDGVAVYSKVGLLNGNTLVVTPYQVSVLGKPLPFKVAEQQAKLAGQTLAARKIALPSLLTNLGLQQPRVTSAGLILQSEASHYTLTIPHVPGC